MENISESYCKGWNKIILMISPNGDDCHAIGGDYAPNPNGCDQSPIAFDFVKKWINDSNELKRNKIPWYLKDKYGWPIEFIKGKNKFWRILFQNFRKITG